MVSRMTLWSASALALLLIFGVNLDSGAATAAKTPDKTLTKDQAIAVEKQEAQTMKALDKAYRKQVKEQAKYYKQLAKQVTKSGANAQSLLDAAAYYDAEAAKY